MKPSHIERDVSGVGLGASLLQTRNGTSCPRDTAPDNTILWPTAFASKSLSSAEEIQQYRKGSIRHITWPQEISSLFFHQRGKYNYRPQIAGSSI